MLPLYLAAMAPYSAAMLFVIDAISTQHRSALPFWSALLTLATLWRWLWLPAVQRRVQEDVRGEPTLPLGKHLAKILLIKAGASFAILWGGLIVIPAFYGFFLSAFAAPALLESGGGMFREVKRALLWIHHSARRFAGVSLALTVAFMAAGLGAFLLQLVMISTLLPSLLGLEAADLSLTLRSWSWFLCLAYLLFVLFDYYWTVASVMVFYDAQSRQLGSDLRLRLGTIQGREA
ncbi:MAG: hypothetical protein HY717_18435 [Planctomycetes bacterium]|nr:hypothetical protein [Planctomycetota bacterium]